MNIRITNQVIQLKLGFIHIVRSYRLLASLIQITLTNKHKDRKKTTYKHWDFDLVNQHWWV